MSLARPLPSCCPRAPPRPRSWSGTGLRTAPAARTLPSPASRAPARGPCCAAAGADLPRTADTGPAPPRVILVARESSEGVTTMGQPVKWDYGLIIRPEGSTTFVEVWRWQRDTTTRFLWHRTDMQGTLKAPTLDN